MFNYDWFFGSPFNEQMAEAKWRCTFAHFPKATPEDVTREGPIKQFHDELEVRQLIYLRDGFSYEIRGVAHVGSKSHFVFECEPVDEHYKVGSFIVTVPFEEIVRVEIFAVHPTEKPEDMPQITGFRSPPIPEATDQKHR